MKPWQSRVRSIRSDAFGRDVWHGSCGTCGAKSLRGYDRESDALAWARRHARECDAGTLLAPLDPDKHGRDHD